MAASALIAGSTGLVGASLLQDLLQAPEYAHVLALGRRAPALHSPRLEFLASDFSDLAGAGARLGCEDVFCCLGTTQRAAGSRAAFERVDYHMVVDLARASRAAGARRFFLVSALGASPRAVAFYSRVKARAEAAVSELGFDTVQIVRPSLLLGARGESRPLEHLAQRLAPLLNPFLRGRLRALRAIPASEVAHALLALARRDERGVHVHTLPL